MNAPAPSAPVAANGTASPAEALAAGRNRKHPGTGVPSALAKGPSKGSALFAQLLSARAAAKVKAAGGVVTAARPAASREAAGLKAAVAAALAKTAVPAAHLAASASPPPAVHVPAHAAEVSKAVARIPAQKKKSDTPETLVVAVHAMTGEHGVQAAKEQKNVAADGSQAPVMDVSRTAAHRAEPLIRVLDLRRKDKPSTEAASSRRLEPAASPDRGDSSQILSRPPSRDASFEPAARPAPAAAPAAATPMDRLHEMAGSELVRASQLVLRDGGGEIRLVLKPDSLGSVRVRMNLVDNAIEGRIIVDSAAVKHVLDGSVDALRRALTAEGFQMGSLQVSVGGQDAQSDPRRQREESPAEVRRIAARGFERSMPGAEDVSLGDLFVNLFV